MLRRRVRARCFGHGHAAARDHAAVTDPTAGFSDLSPLELAVGAGATVGPVVVVGAPITGLTELASFATPAT